MSHRKPATIAVRTGIESDTQYRAVVPPIYLSTNYGFSAFGEVPKYDYTRSGNPNRGLLEQALFELESGKGAVVTNCGTSALNLWVSAFLSPDDLIVAPHDCYGGTYRLFNTRAKGKGILKSALLTNPTALHWMRRWRLTPNWCCLKRLPTRSCVWWTSRKCVRKPIKWARWWRSITPF